VIKRLMDGWRARRFIKDREQLLQSDNPVLAFAGNPAAGTQVLRPGETNDVAFGLLRSGKVPLIRVHDGVEMLANQFGRPRLRGALGSAFGDRDRQSPEIFRRRPA
jgi:hypothetical protein